MGSTYSDETHNSASEGGVARTRSWKWLAQGLVGIAFGFAALAATGSDAHAQTVSQLGCAANGITPTFGQSVGTDSDGDGTRDTYGANMLSAASSQDLVVIEGDPLIVATTSRGNMGVWACQPPGPNNNPPATIWNQWYAEYALTTMLNLAGTSQGYSTSYNNSGKTQYTAVSQVIDSQTAPVPTASQPSGGTGRIVRLAPNETATVTTTLGVTSNVVFRRILSYTNGDYSYKIRFELENVGASTFSDVRLFHGGDTYFGGDDSARSWWNPALNMVYLNNSNFFTAGIMGLQGAPATPADRFFGGQYNTGNSQAASGQLANAANSSYVDAGYYLQWNRASLAPGETWVVEAFERWTDPTSLQVIPPSDQLAAPNSQVVLPFVVHNLASTEQTFELSVSSDQSWLSEILSDTTIVVPGLAQSDVQVRVTVPAGALADDLSSISLSAVNVNDANATGSAFGNIRVFEPDFDVSPTSLDFGRIFPNDSDTLLVTLTNNGSAVEVGNVGTPNGLAAPYSIVGDQCSGNTIPNGSSCDIIVQIAAGTTEGIFNDVFNIPVLAPIVTSFNVSVTGEVNSGFLVETTPGMATYDQTRDAVFVDDQITVDGASNLDGARIAIIAGFDSAVDRLSFTSVHGITGSYDTSTGILSLSGVGTPAQYQDVLRTIQYQNVASGTPAAGGRTIQFSLGAAGLYFEPNGHFYEYVSAPGLTWQAARDAAAARSYFGLQGYLVTVTSAAENTFVTQKLTGQGWMGASDAAAETIWRWVTGPEGLEDNGSGRHFFTQILAGGIPVNGEFSAWSNGEPNQAGNEDYAHFYPNGLWNDFQFDNSSIDGYVVEYGGMPNDPSLEIVATRDLEIITCNDGIANGVETGLDCGSVCGPCGDGGGCAVAGDCTSGVCTGNICQAPTCEDGVLNGSETGLDCGGSCGPCADGGGCTVAGDCASGVCTGNICQAPTCNDGVQNGSETGLDCGGSCGPCGDGGGCAVAGDCTSGVCTGNVCQAPTCNDGVQNGSETGADCGGSCGPCADGGGCTVAGDCTSGVCTGNVCQTPTCDDSVLNGSETGLDCGGSCGPCGDGGGCAVAGDCASGVCTGNVCQAPACNDGVQNGSETGLDCGGSCGPCGDGGGCAVAGDCASGVCSGSVCQAATCDDGVQNGSETDVDCGGSCGPCTDGGSCASAGDCTSGVCTGNVCQAPACDDGVQNGTESDTDCGGDTCGACTEGGSCNDATDCASNVCNNGVCFSPECNDGVQNGTETDIDCGGDTCAACGDGGSCVDAGDCTSGVCDNAQCAIPTCNDGVENANETDVDCGGDTCAPCSTGASCSVAGDCSSGFCASNICVDTIDQLGEITSPADAEILNTATPEISGTADAGTTIEIFIDGVLVATPEADENGNWTYTPTEALEEGERQIEAVFTDGVGNTTSSAITVEIDTIAPTIAIMSPADEQVFSVSPQSISGQSEPGTEIAVYINEVLEGTVTTDENGMWTISIDALDLGVYAVRATATDDATNVGQDESTFSIVDGVNIATPQDDQTVRIARPTFTGVAAPNTSVEIYLNDTLVATVDADENGDWTYTPDSDLADGPWEVRVEGVGESTDSVTFDVDTTRTGLVIDSPAEGALLNEDTVTFNGTALPGATVTITIDGVEVGTVTADQNGAWEWESPAFDDGDYTVEVTSVNEVDEPQTASRSITIDTTPPSLGLTSPADGESFPEDGVLRGTSEPGATVQVFVNGTQVGETTADENGEWTFELPEGTDTSSGGSLRVTSTDEAGNTTSIEREVAPSTPEFDGRVLAGGAGCSVAPTGDDMSPWLLLLGVFGWRMRRRR